MPQRDDEPTSIGVQRAPDLIGSMLGAFATFAPGASRSPDPSDPRSRSCDAFPPNCCCICDRLYEICLALALVMFIDQRKTPTSVTASTATITIRTAIPASDLAVFLIRFFILH